LTNISLMDNPKTYKSKLLIAKDISNKFFN
jgi:hypothetical protein